MRPVPRPLKGRIGPALIAGLCLAAAFACSNSKPPVGRWEGTYESAHALIVARLEIAANGAVYVTAPDAINVRTASEDEREVIRQRLAAGLVTAWDNTGPRPLEFDGRVFRKPGGVAPQLEWDPDSRQMTLVVYPGTQPTIRVRMHAVKEFSDDPWEP